jgi:transglutaminase-like putative cysteine protease
VVGALTMTAAFGALVLVFQNGALEGLLDYSSSHALEASTLVLIFAMSFGLATDYGIFLLSRICEMRRRGHDDADAVRRGLERTGRVVSAAALLLCVALGSLVTARHALVKEVGFGAAVAVAIDATVVRGMLLPSAVRLLSGLAWWSPGARAGRTRAERASATTPVRVSPGDHAPARVAQALEPTRYCDHDNPAIRRALVELGADANGADDRALAMAAFRFVRDGVPYTLGPWGVPASSTLAQRMGMCTNKANLLVSLLRAAGIPAVYGVLRVNAREYFGAVGAPFLTRYVSTESTHVYAAALLGGRWVKCDPSTDRLLASRTSHFCRQTQLIDWDGTHDSLDFLDPRHIYADLGLYASIDELLAKPPRGATPERFALWNDYLDFIRRQPPYPSGEALIAAYRSQSSTQRLLARARERSHRRARESGSLGVD